MNEYRGDSSGSVVLAFLLGGAIGAGLALLFAPRSGEETREKIREMTDEAREKIKDFTDEAKEKVKSASESAKLKLHDSYEHGKEVVTEKASIITNAVEAGKSAMQKERQRLKEE